MLAKLNTDALSPQFVPSTDLSTPSRVGHTKEKSMLLSNPSSHSHLESIVQVSSLTEARQRRRMIDNTIKLLNNRVNLLNQEQFKVQKSTAHIETKVKTLVTNKVEAENMKLSKNMNFSQAKEHRKKQLEDMKRNVLESRMIKEEEMKKIKEMVKEKKRTEYLKYKEEQRMNQIVMANNYNKLLIEQQKKSDKVKKEHEKAAQKKELYFHVKTEQLHEEKDEDRRIEEEAIRAQMKQLQRLATQEELLLHGLGKVQEDHVRMRGELDLVSKSSNDLLQAKYQMMNMEKRPKKPSRPIFMSPKYQQQPEFSFHGNMTETNKTAITRNVNESLEIK
jgi:hypothetical protein